MASNPIVMVSRNGVWCMEEKVILKVPSSLVYQSSNNAFFFCICAGVGVETFHKRAGTKDQKQKADGIYGPVHGYH